MASFETIRDRLPSLYRPEADDLADPRLPLVASDVAEVLCDPPAQARLITQDRQLQQLFLAAKEQIGICGSVIDEALALAALRQRDAWLPASGRRNREHREVVGRWLRAEPRVEWIAPQGGVGGWAA